MKGYNNCPKCGELKVALHKLCSTCKLASKTLPETMGLPAGVITPASVLGNPDGEVFSGFGPSACDVGKHEMSYGAYTASCVWCGYFMKLGHDGTTWIPATKPKWNCAVDGHKLSKGNTKTVCTRCDYWVAVGPEPKPLIPGGVPGEGKCICLKMVNEGVQHWKCVTHGQQWKHGATANLLEQLTKANTAKKILDDLPKPVIQTPDVTSHQKKALASAQQQSGLGYVESVNAMNTEEVKQAIAAAAQKELAALDADKAQFLKCVPYPEIPVELTDEEKDTAKVNKIAAIKMVRARFTGPYASFSATSKTKTALGPFPIKYLSLVDAKESVDAYLDQQQETYANYAKFKVVEVLKSGPPVNATNWPGRREHGRLTFASIDDHDDTWRWAIVTDYKGPQDYGSVLCTFGPSGYPSEQNALLIMTMLNASLPDD